MKKVLVIGDIMLDKYIETSPVRLSDEAPVMIVKETGETYRLGGAANTAANLKAMGFNVTLQGVIGEDDVSGKILLDMFNQRGLEYRLSIAKIPTTVKTRFLCKDIQILRVDIECEATPVIPLIIENVSCVVISDYAKGVIGEKTIMILKENYKVPIIVNGKPKNAEYYMGADVLVVNLKEADEILQRIKLNPGDSYEAIAGYLSILYVVVTKGQKGIAVYDSNGLRSEVYGDIVDVKDITGAGDTVTAAIALELTLSGDIDKAIKLANRAGGIKVTKDKTAEVSFEELNINPESIGILSTEQIISNLESDRIDG